MSAIFDEQSSFADLTQSSAWVVKFRLRAGKCRNAKTEHGCDMGHPRELVAQGILPLFVH